MTNAEYLRRLDRLNKAIAKAFEQAVYARASRVSIQDVTEYVINSDVQAIADAAGLSRADLTELLETVRAGYVQAGVSEAVALRHTFDITNPAAEKWLAAKSSALVAMATKEQVESIRIVMASGMSAGRNPRSVALDIVGRINPVSKRREGGIIGLYAEQVRYVDNARADLINLNENYFTRKARDRRFDKVVAKAIKDDKALPSAQVDAIVARYSDRLLKVRGDNIGRTEALTAIATGEETARQQAIDDGVIDIEFSYKEWSATGDSRTRSDHMEMDGQRVGIDEPFESPSGAMLMHPGDSSMGAPASETINCRCRAVTHIDYIGMQAAREARG